MQTYNAQRNIIIIMYQINKIIFNASFKCPCGIDQNINDNPHCKCKRCGGGHRIVGKRELIILSTSSFLLNMWINVICDYFYILGGKKYSIDTMAGVSESFTYCVTI